MTVGSMIGEQLGLGAVNKGSLPQVLADLRGVGGGRGDEVNERTGMRSGQG